MLVTSKIKKEIGTPTCEAEIASELVKIEDENGEESNTKTYLSTYMKKVERPRPTNEVFKAWHQEELWGIHQKSSNWSLGKLGRKWRCDDEPK
ncbi:unnamed protein product [Lathyrus oleraceus]